MGKRGKFVLGALVGAGFGLLFAPKKGSEIRKELKVKFNELIDKAKEISVDDVTKTIELKISEIKDELNNLDREKVISAARKQASQIKDKAQELVDFAVEKGTPVLKDAALDVKEKAILVAKEAIDRLENGKKDTKKD